MRGILATVSLTTRVLLGLLAGLALGIALASWLPPSWQALAGWIEPIGALWTRALQLVVIPLVTTLLFTGVSAGGAGLGKLGGKGIAFFALTLAAVAAVTLLVAPAIFAQIPFDPDAARALRAASTAPHDALPSLRDWLVALMPSNLVAAMSTGAMLPIIVVTLMFAVAATRLPAENRERLERAAEAIRSVTIIVVRGILSLAPYGVFALAVPLALRLGTTALGAVAVYVVTVAALSLVAIAAMYPLAWLRGVPLRQFARALAPAQGIAVSGRSSLAALPALIDGAAALGMRERVTGFFLPFSTSLFRLGSAVALPVGVLFIAALYRVDLTAAQLVIVGVTSVLLTFSAPGIPGGSILIMAPVLLAVGLPVEGVGILLGVDIIPDMFRTTANVTGAMAAAVVLDPPAR
jgi:proton glutamate symport protein